MPEMMVSLTVNGTPVVARAPGSESLLDVLRDELGLRGSKGACHQGECGSCTVILDGTLVCSCLVMAADAQGSEVVTVEGLSATDGLSEVQEALNRSGAVQCGFCTPGIVVAASELFAANSTPSTTEIKEALAGNVCRCTGYGAIVRALDGVAGRRQR